jgi:organic radical activating enzyme
MNLLEEITRKNLEYKSVDFYLSKSCNKSCYYCTAWTLEMRNLNVDMDFLRKTLYYFRDQKMRINLLGGEPGLIKNLSEVISEIKKNPNHVCSVLSNSFVRKRYPQVLEDSSILYLEHLVLDFHEDRIEKLGNYDFFHENDNNNYNIIIKTPNYFKYRENHDLSNIDHDNTVFKSFNQRAPGFTRKEQAPEFTRRICAAFPKVPVIDFELKKIRHCSRKAIDGSKLYDITQENITKMCNYQLFGFEKYCKVCMDKMDNNYYQEDYILAVMEAGGPTIGKNNS